MERSTHEVRIRLWSKIIKECNESGLSKKQWCRDNNVSEKNFYYWQRVIRNEVYNNSVVPAKEYPVENTGTFIEVPVTQLNNPVSAENKVAAVIKFNNGVCVEIMENASPAIIKQLMGVSLC